MAEGRMLKREISDSKKLGQLKSDRARVLYFMMLPHLDIKGRLKADPEQIKGQICTMLPYSVKSIQSALEALHNVGLILLYQNGEAQFLEYTRFEDFQKLYPNKEAESKIIGPTPEDYSELQRTPLKVKVKEVKTNKGKYTQEFDLFWKKFKGRWIPEDNRHEKGGKLLAFEEWKKLSLDDQRKAWKVAGRPKGKSVPDGVRWLRNRRFDDFER